MDQTVRKIELLAPAKNLSCGIAAIDHGADAVYIGGPVFSARAAAANSLGDIEQLVGYAHLFGAKVYVALNTIFKDEELERAVALAHDLYKIGVDALIIQDVGLLQSDLPPIALHASTQMNNRSVEKVRFWEDVGIEQVVLARELSFAQIKKISEKTTVPLEFFVHGALCVSYSGQCYISEVMTGRSANRGECAQFCRHKFDLLDGEGRVLERDKYLLSLKDLNLSDHIEQLIDAGVSSLKIEGRLKDEIYVKNVTAHYRGVLDKILARRPDLNAASSGHCSFFFQPDPARTFYRGGTDYFTQNKRNVVGEPRTPKSKGKLLGKVVARDGHSFVVDTVEKVVNGDGISFFDSKGRLVGLRVNRVEGQRLFPKGGLKGSDLRKGVEVYRNADGAFSKKLQGSSGCRKVGVKLHLIEENFTLHLTVTDSDGVESTSHLEVEAETAKNPEAVRKTAARQLQKSGDTSFLIEEVLVDISGNNFYPVAVFNAIRREAFDAHAAKRRGHFMPQPAKPRKDKGIWPGEKLSYLDNIFNRKALQFYLDHGVKEIEGGNARAAETADNALMTTKYCVKVQSGDCPRLTKGRGKVHPKSLVLRDNSGEYWLDFNCSQCEMTLRLKKE